LAEVLIFTTTGTKDTTSVTAGQTLPLFLLVVFVVPVVVKLLFETGKAAGGRVILALALEGGKRRGLSKEPA
jgi:hypothetical protein